MFDNDDKKERRAHYLRIGVFVTVLFIVLLICYNLFGNLKATRSALSSLFTVISPFLYGFILSCFLIPLSKRIEKFIFYTIRGKEAPADLGTNSWKKVESIIITYIIVIGIVVLILLVIIPQIVETISYFISHSGEMYKNTLEAVDKFAADHPDWNLTFLTNFVHNDLSKIFTDASSTMSQMLPQLYTIGRSALSFFYTLIMTVILSVYFTWDKERILNGIKNVIEAFIPDRSIPKFREISEQSGHIFNRFLIGKAIDSLIIGIITFVAMNIIGLSGAAGFNRYSLILSLIVGFTNMIPYFGPIIGAIPGVILLLFISPWSSLIFAIMILCIQQFDGNYLGPKILGDATGLAPIWVILAIVVGGHFFGVLGMFLGVPVMAVLVYLLHVWTAYRKQHKSADVSEEAPASPADAEGSAAAPAAEAEKTITDTADDIRDDITK